jgi:hypothetical protein
LIEHLAASFGNVANEDQIIRFQVVLYQFLQRFHTSGRKKDAQEIAGPMPQISAGFRQMTANLRSPAEFVW